MLEDAVPLPSLAVGTVLLPRLAASRDVKLTPLAAGNVAGKRASGTVPEPRFVALRAVRLTPLDAGMVAGKRASGTVPDPRFVAFKAVKFTPLDAGMVAGGVSVDALMSSVAPLGNETVSPDVPSSRAVPLWGSSLSTFKTEAIYTPGSVGIKDLIFHSSALWLFSVS